MYEWMKNLAVYYILLCTVVNLSPDGKYTRYFRYFMGLFLITMICTPIFSLLRSRGELEESFQKYLLEAELSDASYMQENVQEQYLREGYAEEIQNELKESLTRLLGEEAWVEVSLAGEETMKITEVRVLLPGDRDISREEAVKKNLEQVYGIVEGAVSFLYKGDGTEAVAGDSSDRNASGSDSPAF